MKLQRLKLADIEPYKNNPRKNDAAVNAVAESIRDLDLLTIGMVNDMYVESRNDEHKYAVVATQEDFDKF